MAQDFTFGRAGLTTASGGDGLELHCSSWEADGERVSLEAIVRKQSSLNDAKALVAQWIGYGPDNTDEPVIPVTWAEDSSKDGFYRVLGTSHKPELTGRVGSASEAGGNTAWRLEADLLRVPGWQAPLFEVTCTGALRSNTHGVATGLSYIAIPATETTANLSSGYASIGGPNPEYGATSDFVVVNDGGFADLPGKSVLYSIAPSNYYLGSCGISVGSRVASSSAPVLTSHRTISSRQMSSAPTSWLLSNDLVRVMIGPSAGELIVGQWEDSSATSVGTNVWSYKSYKFTSNSGSTFIGDPATVTVLRNSPECCALRLYYQTTAAALQDIYVDLVLRRGAPWVEGVMAIPGATATMGVFRFTAEASTAATGGIDATANDAALNKFRLRTPVAKGNDLVNGGIYNSAAAVSFPFAISTDFFTGVDITDGYWAAMDHRQRIVAR